MDHPHEIGDWKQISILGTGSFGSVELWRNEKNSDYIAIKRCKFTKPNDLSSKQRDRWKMEVDFLKSITHPNIIRYKEIDPALLNMLNKFNPTKLPLMPMEYCRKGNLRRFMTNEPIKLCGLPEQDIRYILEDVVNGLEYLHSKKITHRDMKPDNIVLQHCDKRKGETMYKIIDLGYAKDLQDTTLSFVGTLHYLAPEIFYNLDYDESVDYWSLGNMVFEIICGILPFLPELTPFEKFQKIKTKNPEDICLYMSYAGAISSSQQIKREHFISSCFKENIESWLKRVLQFDPANRTCGSDLSVFEYLRFILDKQIIQAFLVYNQGFYSYEINDSTRLGTIKDWISRDVKTPKNELIFLFGNVQKPHITYHCEDDAVILENLITDREYQDVIVYVYKKEALFCEKAINFTVPHLVKELFNIKSSFQMQYLRLLYRQALFYVFTEQKTQIYHKQSLNALIQHLDNLCLKIHNQRKFAIQQFNGLLNNVHIFLEKKKESGLDVVHPDLTDSLRFFDDVLEILLDRGTALKEFGKQVKIMEGKRKAFGQVRREIEMVFEKQEVESLFSKINNPAFHQRQNGETPEAFLKNIKDIASQTTKKKYNLFCKDTTLKQFYLEFNILMDHVQQLTNWLHDYTQNVQTLLVEFQAMEKRYHEVAAKVVEEKKFESLLTFDVETTKKLLEDNDSLRQQFASLLSGSSGD